MLGGMSKNPFGGPYGSGKTEYERYLRTPELLELQKIPENRAHPDELLFQSIHQVEEIWMKVVVHELGEAAAHLDEDRIGLAQRAIDRACQLEYLVEHQLRLFETMLPSAYLRIRKVLGHGSGLDSPGFNRICEVAPKLYGYFERAVERRGSDLLAVYEDPAAHPDLLNIAEAMVTFDSLMQRFKREHINVVARIIGAGTASLRGNPIDMLERSAKLTFYPMLWAVRERLFIDFKAGPLEA